MTALQWTNLVPSLSAFYPGVPDFIVQQLRAAAYADLVRQFESETTPTSEVTRPGGELSAGVATSKEPCSY